VGMKYEQKGNQVAGLTFYWDASFYNIENINFITPDLTQEEAKKLAEDPEFLEKTKEEAKKRVEGLGSAVGYMPEQILSNVTAATITASAGEIANQVGVTFKMEDDKEE